MIYEAFFISPSLSFAVTTLVFQITSLTIPYDSDDYVTVIYACHFYFSPSEARQYSKLIMLVYSIGDYVAYNEGIGRVCQLLLGDFSTSKQVLC